MARPSQKKERRAELIPLITAVFAARGYRRTTTAQLAAACKVQENTLYRLWPSKKAMFIAAIEHVFEVSARIWRDLIAHPGGHDESPAGRILSYEADHHGELGNYRIVFAGLSEADDPAIKHALRRMFSRFHEYLEMHVTSTDPSGANAHAWALIGLGLVASVGRELGFLSAADRRDLILSAGTRLIGGLATPGGAVVVGTNGKRK
ncbi:MAG: TetR/AcrR family transcriptional regulator [Phycisphaerales bacterium]|nr:TetR/AcrR family transcriptional regulator [Phycisphaerales bacterium]